MTSQVGSCQYLNPLLKYPVFECRFPWSNHPNYEDIRDQVTKMMLARFPFASEKHKQAYLASDPEQWGTLTAPRADKERVLAYTAWVTYFALFDDNLERMNQEEAQIWVSKLVNIMLSIDLPEEMDPMESLLADIVRMIRDAPKDHDGMDEMTDLYLRTTCDHLQWAAAKQDRRDSMKHGVEHYLEYRLVDVAAWCSLWGVLWAQTVVIPPHNASDPDIHKLNKVALIQGTLINDLYSYRKEVKVDDEVQQADRADESFTMFNVIAIFLDYFHLAPAEALAETKRRITSAEEEFEDILEKLRGKYADTEKDLDVVERLASCDKDIMSGNARWSSISRRYN